MHSNHEWLQFRLKRNFLYSAEDLNGELRLFDAATGEYLRRVVLEGVGQVNDVISLLGD